MPNYLFPDPAREVVIGPELGAQLEKRAFAPVRAIGGDLPLVAVTDPPPPVEVRRSPHGTWWLAANADLDPVALSNGGLTYAPPDVVENIRSLRAAGVDLDFVFILHELPGDWAPGTAPPPMKIVGTEVDATAPVLAVQEATFQFGRELLRAAGLAAKGAAALTVGAASAITLDPVVLGGIQDPTSDRIAWVELARWDETPR